MAKWDGNLFGPESECFACAPGHPFGFHLAFDEEDDAVTTRFTPGAHHQGPPGIMHGGLVTTLADEIAAWTVILKVGTFGFTTSMECKLRRAVRVGVPVEGRGRLLSGGRMANVAVDLRQEGELAFEGSFRFAILERPAIERLLGRELPASWVKLAR